MRGLFVGRVKGGCSYIHIPFIGFEPHVMDFLFDFFFAAPAYKLSTRETMSIFLRRPLTTSLI